MPKYYLEKRGICALNIESATECGEAADILGLFDKTAIDDREPWRESQPSYCYFKEERRDYWDQPKELFFNKDGSNRGWCSPPGEFSKPKLINNACICNGKGYMNSNERSIFKYQ